MNCKPLKFKPNWYLTEEGYIFKIVQGKESRVKIYRSKSNSPVIRLDEGVFKIFDLMLEYFVGPIKLTDRVSYKILPDGSIPLKNIIVKPFISKYTGITTEDEELLHKYKCDTKAWAANCRGEEVITPIEVFQSLKIHNFKCIYCNKSLSCSSWHLDHYYPLSRGGANKFENVVPACSRCNVMKSNLDPIEFVRHCIEISNNNLMKNADVQKKLLNTLN